MKINNMLKFHHLDQKNCYVNTKKHVEHILLRIYRGLMYYTPKINALSRGISVKITINNLQCLIFSEIYGKFHGLPRTVKRCIDWQHWHHFERLPVKTEGSTGYWPLASQLAAKNNATTRRYFQAPSDNNWLHLLIPFSALEHVPNPVSGRINSLNYIHIYIYMYIYIYTSI